MYICPTKVVHINKFEKYFTLNRKARTICLHKLIYHISYARFC